MMKRNLHVSSRSLALAGVFSLLCGANTGCAGPGGVAATRSQPLVQHSANFVECGNGVVVSVSAAASDTGLAILEQGGNAVDAAVATALALTVAYPLSSGLGGGGFMTVHPAVGDGDPVVFDYRERSPAAAWPTMYTKEESQHTRRAVAVPGTVRGLALAHRRFGTLPWAQLCAPAVALARDGCTVDAYVAKALNEILADAREFAELQRVFGKPGGGAWVAGDRLVQPDLARTLRLLAELGPDAFYEGPIAAAITAEMQRGGGLITARDLASYAAIAREPLKGRYLGLYDVYVPPPPSGGGVVLLEEIHMLSGFDLKADGRWAARTMHRMAEAMRRANLDRARYMGDPAFAPMPPHLISEAHGKELAATIDDTHATRSGALAPDLTLTSDGEDTTHFSVIDRRGMAVANTYTLERLWGSRIVVQGMGFLLNNDMRAFNLFPGTTDHEGNIGTAPNLIAPHKRPVSSMTPTIVAKDGRVVMVVGSPGSKGIPHTILMIMQNVFQFGMTLQDAVAAPRMSHQWLPDQITFEAPELYPETMAALAAMGHTVVRSGPRPQGDVHVILVREPNHYLGVADRRHSGKASGY
ncbi:MAG: gamma-glutamyltransferase [Planctomycetota bacterium]